jgi:protein-tyrosine-phosphatase
MAAPNSVLFICQMNMVRSPMAEGLLRKLYPEVQTVESCGLSQGEADQLVQSVMSEIGVDIKGHVPQTLNAFENREFDMVVAFTESAFNAAQAFFEKTDSEVLYWPLPNPEEGSLDVRAIMNNYRAMRDVIKNRLIRHFGT